MALLGCSSDDAAALDDADEASGPRPQLPFVQQPDPSASHEQNKRSTVNSGQAYIDECRSLGVPVPDTILDESARWINHGITLNFLGGDPPGELWSWESTDPDGVCLAFPRWFDWDSDGVHEADVLGVICLGRASSTTCYWNNAEPWSHERNQGPIPILELAGGAALLGNHGLMCTDCHAGENPFIVHPDDAAFEDLIQTHGVDLWPNQWPIPVVHKNWLGNPGPIEKLGPVAEGEKRCDSCHQRGGPGGRFPLVSHETDFSGYCSLILGGAVGNDPSHRGTMPPAGHGRIEDYATHRTWLETACDSAAGAHGRVSPPTEITLSPPIIEEPLYACGDHVLVSGARQGAAVAIEVDGDFVAIDTFQGLQMAFPLPAPLEVGQIVEAHQEFGGVSSDWAQATVRDYRDDYPGGLPPPVIYPPWLFECATALAVYNVPHADLVTERNGVPVDTRNSWATHTWIGGLDPAFEIGDEFVVRQSFCGDPSTEVASEPAEVYPAPPEIFAPVFDPETPIAGQTFVNLDAIAWGASVTLVEQTVGGELWSAPSVPYSRVAGIDVATPLGSPLSDGHSLLASQELCGVVSTGTRLWPVASCDPSVVNSVEIAQPHDGDSFVLVTESIPSATIRVLDSNGEIGHGSGDVINLNRALVSAELVGVFQELPGCSPSRAYYIAVL